MSFLIGVPERAVALPSLKEAETALPQLPVPMPAPAALPAVVPQKPSELPALPKAPRLPLLVRLDNAQRPFMNLGPLLFVVTTAIPVAICLAGAAAASFTGGNPSTWINVISLVSPLGTCGIPMAMLGVHVAADAQRRRYIPKLEAWRHDHARIAAERDTIARAAADVADAKATPDRPRD